MTEKEMIEKEVKYIVNAKKMVEIEEKLIAMLPYRKVLQINHYYDSKDFRLYEIGNTLRIRQKEDTLKLQYKYDKKYIGIQKICNEYETEIVFLPKQIESSILPDYFGKGVQQYFYIGNLVTERWDFIHNKDIVSLDKNYYLGTYDCEIEIEYQDFEFVEYILGQLNIEPKEPNREGKYSRYVRAYERIRNNGD